MTRLLIVSLCFFSLLACKQEQQTTVDKTESKDQTTAAVPAPAEQVVTKPSVKAIKAALDAKGFKTFDYVDENTKDTIIMQQYFMAFLKTGPVRNQNEEEAQALQAEHLAHLGKMYDLGYADISGPFGDNGDIRGITIYNVPDLKMADSLANADPMVKAGRLTIEIHPWWAAKGFKLR